MANKHVKTHSTLYVIREVQIKTLMRYHYKTIQFSSAQSLSCNPMNHSTPGLPVHHQLPEFTQTHVHQVGDAIQLSHPLSSPSPPAPNPSQHQSLFQWVNSSHEVAKVRVSALASVLPKKSQGWSPSEWTGWNSLQSKTLKSSPTPQFKSINSSALSLFHSPTLTSIQSGLRKKTDLMECWNWIIGEWLVMRALSLVVGRGQVGSGMPLVAVVTAFTSG